MGRKRFLRLGLLGRPRVFDLRSIHQYSLAVGLLEIVFDGQVDCRGSRENLRVDVLLSEAKHVDVWSLGACLEFRQMRPLLQ